MQLDAYLADINRGITIREFIEAHAPRVLANHDITARHCGLTLLEVSSAQSSSLFQLRVRDTSLPLNKNPSSSPDSSSRSRRKAHKLNSEQTMRSLSLSLSLSFSLSAWEIVRESSTNDGNDDGARQIWRRTPLTNKSIRTRDCHASTKFHQTIALPLIIVRYFVSRFPPRIVYRRVVSFAALSSPFRVISKGSARTNASTLMVPWKRYSRGVTSSAVVKNRFREFHERSEAKSAMLCNRNLVARWFEKTNYSFVYRFNLYFLLNRFKHFETDFFLRETNVLYNYENCTVRRKIGLEYSWK